MSLFQQVRRFFITSSVIMLLTAVMTFGFGSANSMASTLAFKQAVVSPQMQLATMTASNVQGKTKDPIESVTGGLSERAIDKGKELQNEMRNKSKDYKEDMGARIKAAQKNIEGKAQEAMGDVTGDLSDKASGQAKQVESSVRNTVEDIKDKTKSFFN